MKTLERPRVAISGVSELNLVQEFSSSPETSLQIQSNVSAGLTSHITEQLGISASSCPRRTRHRTRTSSTGKSASEITQIYHHIALCKISVKLDPSIYTLNFSPSLFFQRDQKDLPSRKTSQKRDVSTKLSENTDKFHCNDTVAIFHERRNLVKREATRTFGHARSEPSRSTGRHCCLGPTFWALFLLKRLCRNSSR